MDQELPIPKLSVSEIAETLIRQADLEEKFLRHFAAETLPPELERLRPAQIESTVRLIAALREAGEAYRAFSKLPASLQMIFGVLK